ncbi:MAG: DUF1844 domain-containing protein [Deltaproteobacteria bacterium]|jgi:hypothetical protein|nr:DUF1844 domain-containing protein [Deltaproteobacteria bacterium]
MSDITVNDRRLFNKDGTINDPPPEEGKEPSKDQSASQSQEQPKKPEPKDPPKAREEENLGASFGALEANFSTLLIGLATTAMIQLGETPPNGAAPPGPPDLVAAKHSIDILGVLEKKTKGNLDESEESLLSILLYDLRMKYVSVSKAKK